MRRLRVPPGFILGLRLVHYWRDAFEEHWREGYDDTPLW